MKLLMLQSALLLELLPLPLLLLRLLFDQLLLFLLLLFYLLLLLLAGGRDGFRLFGAHREDATIRERPLELDWLQTIDGLECCTPAGRQLGLEVSLILDLDPTK